ncbi:MAG: DUF3768 domain-containing protein [Bauldia sp.]
MNIDSRGPDPRVARIRSLNDDLRREGRGGMVVMTDGVAARPKQEIDELFRAIAEFDRFDDANDPHGEHDLGILEFRAERILWKIDYYDRSRRIHSPDPADPKVTVRVLTAMLASEY